ncbi:hypothetical protein ABIA39_004587 [Nocardia sp. GAS34]|uniref:three-helix bundle dimerization domain-containing protein n=1 Tax=unclassified Nocardia TaxID=2637762 RepID=UPI003D1DFD8C
MGIDAQREDMAEREDKALRELTDQLIGDYAETHSAQRVRTAIDRALHRFDGRTIRDFVPILVERIVRHELGGGPAVGIAEIEATLGTTEPITIEPETTEPDTAEQHSTDPGTADPAGAETGTATSGSGTPEALDPDATARITPDPDKSGTTVADPGATVPGKTGASVTAPDMTTPEPAAAVETDPGATLSAATALSETAPGKIDPSATAPDTSASSAAAPGATKPSETTSGTTDPSATTGATTPDATASGSAAPNATASDPGDPRPTEPAPTNAAAKFLSGAKALVGPPLTGGKIFVAALVAIVIILLFSIPHGTGGSHQTGTATAASVTTVHGVVGSEKIPYFNDPKVVAALAKHGLEVHVQAAGSRQIATSLDLSKDDFAFPSSAPAAERLLRDHHLTAKYTPFSSPMAIATYKPIADLLTAAGVVRPGPVPTLDMNRYMDLVNSGTQWNQLPGNTTYPVSKNILVSTTDPRTSNSADMYVAIASYVANDDTIVRGQTAEDNAVQKVAKLFVGQGFSDNTSQGPFDEYLSAGMGPTPLVLIYEAQFVDAAVHGKTTPDMELMYPSPTILSQHTLVPLDDAGDRLGRLLSTDPDLQRLAAEHGFRTGDPAQFTSVTGDHHIPVAPQVVDVVDPPAYDTLEYLLNGVAKAYN